jgi:uncharacterized membrane protein
MSDLALAGALATALGCGLVAGVFAAFSTFVMPALRRLPAAQGIAAMQSINRTAVRAPFMTLFFGAAVLCVVTIVWAARSWGDDAAPWALAAGILYLVGTIGLTIVRNVPLNDALEGPDPADPGAAGLWARYLRAWTAWNGVRAVAAAVAAGLLIAAVHVA